jgi:TolB-like protein/DNA-binding winged helix-turn-helix (wHTH) protein/lipopolysaccharide biosynthesis regulator YciM
MTVASQTRRIRFGAFEVDLASNELFKHGIRIKLQDQPFQILTILLERPREVVSREELRRKLWAEDTFVDFDAGVNAAIRRLRDALNDSADQPRYIETLPRHGYRFIAETEMVPIETNSPIFAAPPPISAPDAPSATAGEQLPSRETIPPPQRARLLVWLSTAAVTGGLILLLVLSTEGWRHRIFQAHASPRIQSIAVLPLQNLSGDPAQEYFADGMTDALITNLAHISSLQVISRTSVMRYKNSREPLSKISKDLNVDAVVEGSVVRAGNRVRINAQLIEASSDRHVWASAFERDMSDVLTLQDEAAKSIATEIAANLTHQDKLQQKGAKTINPAAYEAYLKANYFEAKQSSNGFEKAKQYYEQSIALDPTFAPAYVGLAEVYAWLAYTQRQAPAAASVKAESLLARALEIDSASSDAYVMRGMIKLQYRCDRAGAEKDLTQALDLDPTNVSALDYHSYYLLELGRWDEAIAEKKRVVALDPVSVGTISELGLYYDEAGRYEEAIQELQRALELDPNFAVARKRLGIVYANQGHFEQAITELKKGIALDQTPGTLGLLGDYYARSGNKQEALETIEELKGMSRRSYASPALIALIYARLGDENQALEWLGKAKPEDQANTGDPGFDFVRSNPRFKVIEAQLKPKDSCPLF